MSDTIQAFGKDGICAVCKRNPVNRWCDYIMEYDKPVYFCRDYKNHIAANSGDSNTTCDLPMCDECALSVGTNKDLCPHHKSLFYKRELPDAYQRTRAARERTKIAMDGLQGGSEGMKEWCLTHPWMTFFIIVAAIVVIGETIQAFGKK